MNANPTAPAMLVTVLHNVDANNWFGVNTVLGDGSSRELPRRSRSHPLVRVFEAVLDEQRIALIARHGAVAAAEHLFMTFNVGDEPGRAEDEYTAQLAHAYRARRLRSLSVGDVLMFGDAFAVSCERFGWQIIDAHDLLVLDAAAGASAARKRYQFRPGEQLTLSVPLADDAEPFADPYVDQCMRGGCGQDCASCQQYGDDSDECGAELTIGPAHDPYGTSCDQPIGHYPATDHAGPHPMGMQRGDRITWTGGGTCAGDALPFSITGQDWAN